MIGVFDSGIGGLTVVKEIKKAIPHCQIIYFGDTARYPWGNKSPELVKKYSSEICDFLIGRGAKNIVIACNTASTFSTDYLKKKYPKTHFYDVINPVIKRIENESRKGKIKIGIIGTRGTIGSKIYENKINNSCKSVKTFSKSCPLFVSIAEEGMNGSYISRIIAQKYLGEWKNKKIDYLVLGCTHYPLLRKAIKEAMGNVTIISSAEEIARDLKNKFQLADNNETGDIYYFSDLTEHYKKLAENIIGGKINVKKAVP